MFGTIRKHQKWLWLAIVIPTIITFVWYFGPASRVNSSNRRVSDYGSVDGKKISENEYARARREVELHYFFNSQGHWPEEDKRSGFDAERETYQWLLLLHKQEELGIHVSDDVTDEMARQLVHPFERMGVTSPTMFVERLLQPHGIAVEDFERFVRHFVGVQQLIATVGVPGRLVTAQEAKELYKRDHQELATEAVFFSTAQHLEGVPAPTPAVLSQFYSNMIVRYAVPERVQVSFVRFNVTNYLAQAESDLKTNLNDMVDANVQRLGTNAANYFPDAKTPEEIKVKVRAELIRRTAMGNANKKALEFDTTLYDLAGVSTNGQIRPELLQELARTNGLTTEVAPPFDREIGPTNLEVTADFTKRAFELTPESPFSQPIPGRDGIYVLSLLKQLPRETPSFEQIHDKVLADYKHEQAMTLAQQAAAGFFQTLTNGLAQGSTFTNLCAAAKLKPTPLPPFSLATRTLPEFEDLVNLNQLKQAAFTTEIGRAALIRDTPEGSVILFVKSQVPLDQAKAETDLPNYLNALRHSRQQEAFEDWFRRQAERGLRDTPLFRAKPPPGSAAS